MIPIDHPVNTVISTARQAATWLACRKAAQQIDQLIRGGDLELPLRIKAAFVGSFTLDPIIDYAVVEAAASGIALEMYKAPFGQVSSELLNPQSGLYAFEPEIVFVLAEPETLADSAVEAADQLIDLAQTFKQNASGVLAVSNFINADFWPLHVLPSAAQRQTEHANRHLAEAFADDPRVQLNDLNALAAHIGIVNALSPEMQALARVPFSAPFLQAIARRLVSHISALRGWTQKCLVLDCDNTLWGGIIGEDGMDGIALGPDCPGREFVAFQKAIRELYDQGVILAINSKNNPADVAQVLREHPHMLLREEHFAAVCVNWEPKPDNMRRLAAELNIGLDSMVFADDNPAERQLMRQMLPQVRQLDLPPNPALYARALRQTSFFTRAALSEEDRLRGRMYAAQRQRSELQKSAVSFEEYLKSLEMVCSIKRAADSDIRRIAQLTQRTNQFNLTTRRYTEADIQQMLNAPDCRIYVLRLRDKFGDNGTVGLAVIRQEDRVWRIDTFLMSCRVIGRRAEEALVDRICGDAVQSGIRRLHAEYIATAKNKPAADFWDRMRFKRVKQTDEMTEYCLDSTDYLPGNFEYFVYE